jgi:hypothetical protein
MDPGSIAPMVMAMTLFITTGLVLILRPISKRLGSYLEVLAEERRRANAAPPDDTRVLNALENIERRMARLEERQAFTDALLAGRKPAELAARSEADYVDRSGR